MIDDEGDSPIVAKLAAVRALGTHHKQQMKELRSLVEGFLSELRLIERSQHGLEVFANEISKEVEKRKQTFREGSTAIERHEKYDLVDKFGSKFLAVKNTEAGLCDKVEAYTLTLHGALDEMDVLNQSCRAFLQEKRAQMDGTMTSLQVLDDSQESFKLFQQLQLEGAFLEGITSGLEHGNEVIYERTDEAIYERTRSGAAGGNGCGSGYGYGSGRVKFAYGSSSSSSGKQPVYSIDDDEQANKTPTSKMAHMDRLLSSNHDEEEEEEWNTQDSNNEPRSGHSRSRNERSSSSSSSSSGNNNKRKHKRRTHLDVDDADTKGAELASMGMGTDLELGSKKRTRRRSGDSRDGAGDENGSGNNGDGAKRRSDSEEDNSTVIDLVDDEGSN